VRIELSDLTLVYDGVRALDGLNAVVDGRIIGVLGANASGKTSLLRILAGLQTPTAGGAAIDGQRVRAGRRSQVSYLPQETGVFPFRQRPSETLSLSMHLHGIAHPGAARQLLASLGLQDRDTAETLSGGMKQKLRIAQALVHAPQARLLLLDEPTTGLDTRERFRVLRMIQRLATRLSVLFSTHQPEDVAAICDQVLLLHCGRLVAAGSPEEITARAAGAVYEISFPGPELPVLEGCEIVRAERTGEAFTLRVVGTAPEAARPVPPRLEDAVLLLTMDSG
jgi:ABC-2 type transport system ATP-binding protein